MNWAKQRKELVKRLRDSGYLRKSEVIDVIGKVPRHRFVPPVERANSYIDMPLPIGYGQTISAPHMVSLMTEALDIDPGHRVLELGTGSGYQAAVLAELLKEGIVYSLERVPELAERARKLLSGYGNVHVICREGTVGYPEKAPFDRILVTAGAPKVPSALIDQLADGGKLLIPVGGRNLQDLLLFEKKGKEIKKKNLGGCMFVPLLGADGW